MNIGAKFGICVMLLSVSEDETSIYSVESDISENLKLIYLIMVHVFSPYSAETIS